MCVCMCASAHVSVCACECACECACVHTASVHACVCACVRALTYECVHVSVRACESACVSVCTCVGDVCARVLLPQAGDGHDPSLHKRRSDAHASPACGRMPFCSRLHRGRRRHRIMSRATAEQATLGSRGRIVAAQAVTCCDRRCCGLGTLVPGAPGLPGLHGSRRFSGDCGQPRAACTKPHEIKALGTVRGTGDR